MRVSFALSLLAGLALTCSQVVLAEQPEPLVVEIEGAVLNPGGFLFPQGARLNSAAATGRVRADAWFVGAALLRQSAINPQQRLKSGILFELNANRVHARAQNNQPLLELANRMYGAVKAMPTTGRVTVQLDPLQQLILANNDLLEHGDKLIYPLRPDHVRVTGAVQADCRLDHQPYSQARDYLRACPRHALADPSFVYLVQPNGQVQRLGTGYWNTEPANVALGAVIYVPLQPNKLAPDTTGLNDDMAAMLATQYALGGRFAE
ncbi:MAG: capsule biosynthesis GfcC family protein [Pseudomonas sp.]